MAYMSEEGYKQLIEELKYLESVERPKIVSAIAEARDKGDLSENAEYDAAKEAQGLLEMKISQLKSTIGDAKIIDTSKMNAALLDSNKLHELDAPVLQAEDFGIYTQQYPCVFFFLGVGDTPALHDPTFDFDMDVLENGVEWYKTILFTENLLVKIDSSSKEERVNNDEFIQSI